MVGKEYKTSRSKYIRESASDLAHEIPLKKYLTLHEQFIKDEELHQSDNCPDSEARWFDVFYYSHRKGTDIIDQRLHQPVGQIIHAKVVGLKPWIHSAPEETNLTVAVKNHTYSPALQEIIGRPNVLVVYDNIAFVGKRLRPNRVCVTRPVIGDFQEGLMAMFKKILKPARELKRK